MLQRDALTPYHLVNLGSWRWNNIIVPENAATSVLGSGATWPQVFIFVEDVASEHDYGCETGGGLVQFRTAHSLVSQLLSIMRNECRKSFWETGDGQRHI
jgi:hypothetical protein